jgi:hypothetical protein
LSALGGALSGASLGFIDEIGAAGDTLKAEAMGAILEPGRLASPGKLLRRALDGYRGRRDDARRMFGQLSTDNPEWYTAGELAGAVAMPVPGAAAVKGATLGARLAQAAGQGARLGATYGLGSSGADLTQGDVRGAAGDAALGAGAGALGGALGESMLSGGRWLLNRARGRASAGIEKAAGEALAAKVKAREKAVKSEAGSLGETTANTFKTMDRLKEIVADTSAPAELRASAQARLNSPVFKEAMRNAQAEYVAKADGLLGRIVRGREAVAEAAAVDVEAQAAEALAHPMRTQVLPRLKTYASRMLPPIVGAVTGSAMGGGVAGATVGSILGTGVGAVMGNPGTALANMMKSPAVRKGAWETVRTLTGGAAPEATALAAALRRTPRALEGAGPVLSEAAGLAPRLRRVADRDEDADRARGRALAEAIQRQP